MDLNISMHRWYLLHLWKLPDILLYRGSAFGNHACFYCDTTVLASQGSGIDNFDHAVSQLPYVLIGAAVSIVCFLVLGFVY